jgi:hypothetical protein
MLSWKQPIISKGRAEARGCAAACTVIVLLLRGVHPSSQTQPGICA